MKIMILTEGGANIGLGHVVRCIALCQAFEKCNLIPEIIINGSGIELDSLKKRKFKYLNWLEDRKKIFEIIRGYDIVIIDSFIADEDFYLSISELVKTSVFLDDNNRINYPKGLVINVSLFANELNYLKKESTTYLLGTLYTILRKDFWNIPNKSIRKNIKSIIITMGGDDSNNMTPKIVDFLVKNFPQLKKNIIIGCWFDNIESIQRVSDKRTTCIHNPKSKDLLNIMLNSDLAISAGGQTLYEFARVGLPVIGIGTASNQLHNLSAWERAGFLNYAGMYNDQEIFENFSIAINKLSLLSERLKCSAIGRNFVDGKGAERISNYLLNN